MVTKVLTRCYRFDAVDFEPDLSQLTWNDGSKTKLTTEESRLLESLCYSAGEVISASTLSQKIFCHTETTSNLYTILLSLNRKLHNKNIIGIQIETLPDYGYRVPIPVQTCQTSSSKMEPEKKEQLPQLPDNSKSSTHFPIETPSVLHYLLAIATLAVATFLFIYFG